MSQSECWKKSGTPEETWHNQVDQILESRYVKRIRKKSSYLTMYECERRKYCVPRQSFVQIFPIVNADFITHLSPIKTDLYELLNICITSYFLGSNAVVISVTVHLGSTLNIKHLTRSTMT